MTYAPKFIIDSNILIESKNVDYGFDICPGFWVLMEKALKEGLVISHAKVRQELMRRKDDLWGWASMFPKECFPKETDEDFAVYRRLCEWARNGEFKQAAIDRFCEVDYADPWICAKAKAEGLTLVTQEVSEPYSRRNIQLPDACNAIGVSCCNKYELLRALRARFVLDEAHSFA